MKIASFTLKGKRYIITSSDWFWGKVRDNKAVVAGFVMVSVVALWVWLK
jgi:hypothetical protein